MLRAELQHRPFARFGTKGAASRSHSLQHGSRSLGSIPRARRKYGMMGPAICVFRFWCHSRPLSPPEGLWRGLMQTSQSLSEAQGRSREGSGPRLCLLEAPCWMSSAAAGGRLPAAMAASIERGLRDADEGKGLLFARPEWRESSLRRGPKGRRIPAEATTAGVGERRRLGRSRAPEVASRKPPAAAGERHPK